MNEVAWSTDHQHEWHEVEPDVWCCNKLYVTPKRVSYKVETWVITKEHVYKDFLAYIALLYRNYPKKEKR